MSRDDAPAGPAPSGPAGVRPGGEPFHDDRIAAVVARARRTVAGRIAMLRATMDALLAGELDEAGRAAAEQEAHTLVGTAGTFGLGRVTDLARELEELLGRPCGGDRDRQRAAHLVRQMADAVDPPSG